MATPHLLVFKAQCQYSQGLPSRRGTSTVVKSLECVPQARDNPLPPREVTAKNSREQGRDPGETAQAGDLWPPRSIRT